MQNFTLAQATKDVTVVVCTWNRADSLARTLRSFVSMKKPAGLDWEVLIVNNNSTDNTDTVIHSFTNILPIVRLFEGTPGLSNARNTAVLAASGRYIIWTDDDVIVDIGWMEAYLAAFHQHPHASLLGGPIYARFEGCIPKWLELGWRSAPSAFCHNDLGSVVIPLSVSPRLLPFGANFAVKSPEQKRLLYDSKLGACPGGRYMGEETTVMIRLLSEGGSGVWIPTATVQHMNGQDRMTLKYLLSYYEKVGQTQSLLGGPEQGRKLLNKPLWLWYRLVQTRLEYLWLRTFSNPNKWVAKFAEYGTVRGRFRESGRKLMGLSD